MRIDLGPSLATVRERALVQIDEAAEKARLRYVTPGAGQAMEYTATEAEARRWRAAVLAGDTPHIVNYPFLKAELDALTAVAGEAPDVSDVVAEVINQADAWVAVGSEIKRIRREAKIAVEAAGTVSQVRSIVADLVWP